MQKTTECGYNKRAYFIILRLTKEEDEIELLSVISSSATIKTHTHGANEQATDTTHKNLSFQHANNKIHRSTGVNQSINYRAQIVFIQCLCVSVYSLFLYILVIILSMIYSSIHVDILNINPFVCLRSTIINAHTRLL